MAFEVARGLHLPLDVFVVRKLGVPGHEELAMGAIASGGVRVLNEDGIRDLALSDTAIERAVEREARELRRRDDAYRDDRPLPNLAGCTVLRSTKDWPLDRPCAAVQALRRYEAGRLVVAVPTAAVQTCEALAPEVDEIVCAITREPFYAVGLWYDEFPQTSDQEVRDLLARARTWAVRTR